MVEVAEMVDVLGAKILPILASCVHVLLGRIFG